MFNPNILDITIVGPAFIAGLLVLASHVPLGREVLKRGIIFIDLAIAQIAALGVILAARFGFETHGWEVQLIAISSALIGAWGLSLLEKHQPQIQEALIGVAFILAATGGILLLADHPHGGEQLEALLIGQILWITWDQLLPLAVATLIILLAWVKFHGQRPLAFYLLFAVAITSSVQLVGVYLVFASLIIPALASRGFTTGRSLGLAYGVGVLGYGLGLIGSSLLDLPSGAVIVWVMAVLAPLLRAIFRGGKQTN
ncbi:MAG: metal ABC transporter permease [Gammaproteobacteria bacterium]